MTDQTQVIPAARRLLGLGAFHGAAQVLFHAAVQRESAEARDLQQWSPAGKIPLRRKAQKHPAAANDKHADPSQQPGGTVA